MTLSEYILKFKINESKNLLKYTNKPIIKKCLFYFFCILKVINMTITLLK